MQLVPYLVPNKLSKIEKLANGILTNYGPKVKLSNILKSAIWVAKNVEIHIKDTNLENIETREKSEGFSKANKKRRFSKLGSNNKKSRNENRVKCYDKYKKKHFGRYGEVVTYFEYGKTGHYANGCTSNKKVCFECG